MNERGSYVQFQFEGTVPGGKTLWWTVLTRDDNGLCLGQIRWFSRWRKYAFYPQHDTIFEEKCLNDIAQFIAAKTRQHKRIAKDVRS